MLLSSLTNYRRLSRFLFRSFVHVRGTAMQLSGKRIRTLAIFLVIFPVMHIAALIGLIADDLFYPGHRRVAIKTPTFIVGNFRSGSTFLHRLLAIDSATFSSFRTWEIYLAPSITQRKLYRGIMIVDQLLGGYIRSAIIRREHTVFEKVQMHRVSLTDAEEDEGIFLYIWSGLFVWFFFPLPPEAIPFIDFERSVPPVEKCRMMRFYSECIRRHLYAEYSAGRGGGGGAGVGGRGGGGRGSGGSDEDERLIFLSKNPSFSPKIPTLLHWFPDARFIYLARNPREMVPSETAWLSFAWHYFSSPTEKYPYADAIADMAQMWFALPLSHLSALPDSRVYVVRFEDLIRDPGQAVRAIYARFGIPLKESILRRMASAAKKPREMGASGKSLTDVGLDRETIDRKFADVYRRFSYNSDVDHGVRGDA